MKRNTNEIKQLKEENEFLKKGINSREKAYDTILEDRNKQLRITKELTYLLLYMEVVEDAIKGDYTPTSKVIHNAINHFKQEITNGFYADGKITNTINDSTDEE
jgi:hypothetical protein